jgi:CheY-like chemotaxis protein
MDGWETARAIRKDWPLVKIVLVTGYGPTAIPPDGEEDLIDGIIGKPFNFGQVSSTLMTLKTPTKELLNA